MTLALEFRVSLNCEYDAEGDVLYAWVGEKPRDAVTYETDQGHLVRLDPETMEFVGVTIIDFKDKWSDEPIRLEWQVEREQAIPWIPRLARKRRQRVEERGQLVQLHGSELVAH